MPSKNKFERFNDDEIHIMGPGWSSLGFATYRKDYWQEMTSVTWHMDEKGYISNKKLGGYLHRYMMSKWYGQDVLDEFTNSGYVVDHINNEHSDCRISNLEFLKKNYNTAKGNELDIDVERLYQRIALSIYKDFDTRNYQITIGCNDYVMAFDQNGDSCRISSVKLLYDGQKTNAYRTVLHDAESLLTIYESENEMHLYKTNVAAVRIYLAPKIELSEEERKQPVVFRNEVPLIVIGNGTNYIKHIAPDKGWVVPNSNGEIMAELIQETLPER